MTDYLEKLREITYGEIEETKAKLERLRELAVSIERSQAAELGVKAPAIPAAAKRMAKVVGVFQIAPSAAWSPLQVRKQLIAAGEDPDTWRPGVGLVLEDLVTRGVLRNPRRGLYGLRLADPFAGDRFTGFDGIEWLGGPEESNVGSIAPVEMDPENP